MRKIYFMILLSGILIVLTEPVISQEQLNINISSQPIWGPVGYDAVQYYYIPEIETYYNVLQQKFIYSENGKWITSSNLDYRFKNYNLYNAYKVVINKDRPYLNNNEYREKYASYKNHHGQLTIRDSRDSKYFVNKNHPQHDNWVKKQKHNHGKNESKDHENKQN